MTDILLTGILITLVLIWLQGNRIGGDFGKWLTRTEYRIKTRRRE